MTSGIEFTPPALGQVADRWEEQSGTLHTAAGMLHGADSAGFSDRVRAAAGRFAQTWAEEARSLERQAESQADRLRAAIRTYLESEAATAQEFVLLVPHLEEGRR
ncbi:MAG: hypothetical protein M3291_06185 [Actinomycetota bacterium]|nr:hypothetical protein [Actinomycetota bacterium]